MKPITVAFPTAGRKGNPDDSSAAHLGGAEISTVVLAKYLQYFGVEPIFLVHNNGPTIAKLNEEGFKAYHVDLPFIPKREEITSVRLESLNQALDRVQTVLKDYAIDFVHTNDANMHRSWGYYCQQLNKAHIWHERGLFSHPKIAHQWLENATSIISISDYVTSLAKKELRSKIVTIQDPLIPENIPEAIEQARVFRASLNLETSSRLIAMVANSNKRKRWDLFAKIAAKTNRRHPTYKFAVIGIRHEKVFQGINAIYQNKGGAGDLINLGYQDNILAVMAACDCMLATAQQEPLGRTPVEALFVGTPIIASSEGGHVETLNDMKEHFLSPDDNELSYAILIRKAIESPQYHREGLERLSKKLRKKHDPLAHAKAVTEVYRKL